MYFLFQLFPLSSFSCQREFQETLSLFATLTMEVGPEKILKCRSLFEYKQMYFLAVARTIAIN